MPSSGKLNFTSHLRIVFACLFLMTPAITFANDFTEKDFLTRNVGFGLYELSVDTQQNAIFVASAPSFDKGKTTGHVYKLDLEKLTTTEVINTSHRAFATALDETHQRLYIGNSLDGTVTVIDTSTGKELSVIPMTEGKDEANFRPTREMVVDSENQRLYVSSTADNGVLWVIDTLTEKKIATVEGLGHSVTGISIDKTRNAIYLVNGDSELITLDINSYKIKNRFTLEKGKKRFLLNISLDEKNGRIFITDIENPGVMVVNVINGKIIHTIDVTNSLDVLFNSVLNEIYVTHRNARKISIIDGESYKIKDTVKTKLMPNSIGISKSGRDVYVSVKHDKEKMSTNQDYIIKLSVPFNTEGAE